MYDLKEIRSRLEYEFEFDEIIEDNSSTNFYIGTHCVTIDNQGNIIHSYLTPIELLEKVYSIVNTATYHVTLNNSNSYESTEWGWKNIFEGIKALALIYISLILIIDIFFR